MKQVNLAHVDLNLTKVFVAIYEERNVTRAARRLELSQSGVSHALRNLRAIFDDPLFVRTPHGMTPTALAERISVRIRFALNEMQDVLSVRGDFHPESAEAQITIGLLSGPPSWLVAGLCRAVQERAPGIGLAFRLITAPDLMPESMDNRLVNIVIGSPDHVDDRRRFTYTELFGDDLVCVVGRDNRLVGEAIDLESYARLPHLAVAAARFNKTWVDDLLTKHGLSRTIAAVVPSPVFVADVLAHTDMICLIMRNLAPQDPRLRILPPPFPTKPHRFGQFTHARDDDNPLILWLRALVQEVCAERVTVLDPAATRPAAAPQR